MPDGVCQALIEWIDSGPAKCTPAQATTYTASLLARYPDTALKDFDGLKQKSFKLYYVQIYEAFCGFSSRVCEAALALPDGSLAKLDYTPRVPEIIKALIAEQDRLALMKANAKSHMAERKRRFDADRERREFEASLPTIEERKAQVARLIASMRLKPVEQPVPLKPRYQVPTDAEEQARQQRERDAEIAAHYDCNFTPDGRPRT